MLKSLKKRKDKVTVIEDANAKVGDESIHEVTDEWKVPRRNANGDGEMYVDITRKLPLARSHVQCKVVHKYTCTIKFFWIWQASD